MSNGLYAPSTVPEYVLRGSVGLWEIHVQDRLYHHVQLSFIFSANSVYFCMQNKEMVHLFHHLCCQNYHAVSFRLCLLRSQMGQQNSSYAV